VSREAVHRELTETDFYKEIAERSKGRSGNLTLGPAEALRVDQLTSLQEAFYVGAAGGREDAKSETRLLIGDW
jgi:hypothetical protein